MNGEEEKRASSRLQFPPLEHLGGTVDDIYFAERGLWSAWALGKPGLDGCLVR